jgi:DNA-binding transcriptional ArsR family regulator/rhodanese-related sulfurtransferase
VANKHLTNSLSKRDLKSKLYGEFAAVAAALANPRRLELLDLLCQRDERSVEDIASESGLSVAGASQHLKVLRSARLICSRRQQSFVYYRLADVAVARLWQDIRDFAAHSPEVGAILDEHLGARPHVIGNIGTLMERVARGDVTLLDARPIEEYRSGHLPGAKPLPPGEVEEHLIHSLDARKQIVVYCRGPFCTFADEAVELLCERGFMAQRLELGVPEWRRLGFAVAVGES